MPRKADPTDLEFEDTNPRLVSRGMIVQAKGTQKPEVVLQVDVILHLSNGESNVYVCGPEGVGERVQRSLKNDDGVYEAVEAARKTDPDAFKGILLPDPDDPDAAVTDPSPEEYAGDKPAQG